MKILTLTTLFPNNQQPTHGIFVKKRIEALAELVQVKVVAPVPWSPNILRNNAKYRLYSQIPLYENHNGLEVFHPRYLVIPKIGRSLYGLLYFYSLKSYIMALKKSYDFDLLDLHWAYPDGFAGVLLAKFLEKPVTITIRGTDLNLYPNYVLRREMISFALKKANRVISVCDALKRQAINLGIEESKITVISNGVDTTRFYPLNKKEARIKLGLPLNNRIILGAGHLIERKGFHHLIDAIHILVEQGKYHDILTVIVGEGDFRGNLERQVARLKLELYVRLVGIKPNEELVYWYNAADIFSLVSSREGWPNVLFESLACGTPVVATAVWGTPEVINSEEYGLLVQKQEPRQIAEALEKALEKKWDTNRLIKYARENTWDKVARKVLLEFEKVLSHK